MQITVKFTPVAPPANRTFASLAVSVIDAGGTSQVKQFNRAQLEAQSTYDAATGKYALIVDFTAPMAVGPYTGEAKAWGTDGSPMGTPVAFSGSVSLADGTWFAQPSSAA